MDLGVDLDDLNTCVQCGLCLSACPTFRVTGDETMSPRGRIALMRAVQLDGADLDDEVVEAFDTCVQCRGCEPACPSGVPYGRLMEATRTAITHEGRATPWWLRIGLRQLAHPRRLRAGTAVLAVAQRMRLVPARLGLPDLPFRRTASSSAPADRGGETVVLFTGCVMDAWQRDVHDAAERVLRAAGFDVVRSGDAAPCCGALHAHAGMHDDAVALARRTVDALPDDVPVVVDSAGCGAAMKEYGHLLSDVGTAFSARVVDLFELLATRLDRLPDRGEPLDLRVAVHDPCHLRHVQRVHEATRRGLAPFVAELVELDDDGVCCGAGGAYSMVRPTLAATIADRKLAAIERVVADVVVSANPGCSMHLTGRSRPDGPPVVHPITLVDRALQLGTVPS